MEAADIKTSPISIEPQKRLDITVKLPTGTTFVHTIRDEVGDQWTMVQGVMKIRLFAKKGDDNPEEEHIYFAGHVAGFSYRYYTQMVRVPTPPLVVTDILPSRKI